MRNSISKLLFNYTSQFFIKRQTLYSVTKNSPKIQGWILNDSHTYFHISSERCFRRKMPEIILNHRQRNHIRRNLRDIIKEQFMSFSPLSLDRKALLLLKAPLTSNDIISIRKLLPRQLERELHQPYPSI